MVLAESVVNLRQDGAERSVLVVAIPETEGIEPVTQNA